MKFGIFLILLLVILVLVYIYCNHDFIVYEIIDIAKKKLLTITTKQNSQIPIAGGFERQHHSMNVSFPWVAGIAIDVDGDNHEEIFLGGDQDQDDALLYFDGEKLVDRIQGTGLSSKSATYGGVSIDLNNDGYQDLIVARQDGVWIYTNNHDRTFSKHQIMKEQSDRIPAAITVTDIDKDGIVDIYISNFIRSKDLMNYQFHNPEHSKTNVLLKGTGEGQFTDITESSGTASHGNTFTSAFVDLNNDTLPDLIVAQDAGEVEIYQNLGQGKFKRRDVKSGFGFWMGLAHGDYDNDGDIDLFLTNISDYNPTGRSLTRPDNPNVDLQPGEHLNHNHILLQNEGNFKFKDVSKDLLPNKYGFGWGAVFDDLNLDRKLDLLFSVNYTHHPIAEVVRHPQPVLIQGDQQFEQNYSFAATNFGHTPLLVDVNRDGVKDVMWVNIKGPVQVFSNENWKNRNYLNVRVPSNLKFTNARIILLTDDGQQYVRENVQGGIGFSSDQSETHSFGLGSSEPAQVIVETIYGDRYVLPKPKKNSTVVLRPTAKNIAYN